MTVTINGQVYELHFGMKAAKAFYSTAGVLNEEDMLELELAASLIWAALENGAFRQRKTLDLQFAQVCDWVEEGMFDEERLKVITSIWEAFRESEFVKKLNDKIADKLDEVKKKSEAPESISTGLKPSASDTLAGQSTNTSAPALEPSY